MDAVYSLGSIHVHSKYYFSEVFDHNHTLNCSHLNTSPDDSFVFSDQSIISRMDAVHIYISSKCYFSKIFGHNCTSSALTSSSVSLMGPPANIESSIPIDPRLLLLDGGDVAIEHDGAERLDSLVYHNVKKLGEDEQSMGLEIFLDNADYTGNTSILTPPGREFVETLSKINIVRKTSPREGLLSVDELFRLEFMRLSNSIRLQL